MRFSRFFILPLVLALTTMPAHRRVSAVKLDAVSLRAPFVLELPDLQNTRITAPEFFIPTADLHTLRLYIKKPFDREINYGKIFTHINGEAAATIQNIRSSSDGYIITCDLDSKPRFKLQPGRNVVEIRATTHAGRTYYASYLLQANAGNRNALANSAAPSSNTIARAPANPSPAFASMEAFASTNVDDRNPPEIYLSEPSGAVVRFQGNKRTLKVEGVVMEESGDKVSLTINNQSVPLSSALAAPSSAASVSMASAQCAGGSPYKFSSVVNVSGDASVTLEAADKSGNRTRLTLPVTRNGKTPATNLNAQPSSFKGRKFAVVIGISDYKFNAYTDAQGNMRRLTDLKYAARDARSVRDFLLRPEGGSFTAQNVLYLEDASATLEAVRVALDKFLAKAAPEDLVFFYLAGHGAPDPRAPQNLYFLMHDTKLSDAAHTALPMTELKNMLDNSLRAERVVVFIDTCHSAGITGEQLTTTRGEVEENNLINLYASKLFAGTGRIVLTASDTGELSRECPFWGDGHGIFTWSLLEGLGGKADDNQDRLITATELCTYMRSRVQIETAFNQNPRLIASTNDDFALSFTMKRDGL